ncbi:MAG TPA: endolytic transglycosylase MltG [Candidatus Saccharimonadales bacterium]|nr:endolytic transglycosylase MltG [Candidatus Saccharimonadales bacterium]
MDIKPLRPFKRQGNGKPPIPPKRPQPQKPQPRQSSATTAEGEPLNVPEELLEAGHKTPLILAKNPPKSRKKWWILGILGALLLVIVAAIIAGFAWYNDALLPRSSEDRRIRIVIEQGATPEQIADELEQKEVIKSSFAFQLLMRQSGDRDKLQAGVFLFTPKQPAREILTWLVEGKVDTFNVTILPGQTLVGIKKNLIKDGFAEADIDAAFTKKYDHALLASKPDGVNLDGYIYPDTYQISSDTTAEQLLVRTFDEFYAKIQEKGLQPQLAAKGFNLHQGITLASIIQRETSTYSDQRQVAQVFEKRLKDGMQLGSDVTFMYAAELLGQQEAINIDSPYNTRRYTGLPPGAIANFNITALTAVADPAPGDYLFFVAGDDGTTYFARTEAEHQSNIDRYCTKLCAE